MQPSGARASAGRHVARASEKLSRVGAMQAIPLVMEQLGVEPSALFSRIGIPAQLFANPDRMIPSAEAGRLLRACAESTDCDHFGLLVGAQADLASLRLFRSLARHAPDVRAGLRAINSYLFSSDSAAIVTLSEHGALATWSYALYKPDLDGTDQLYQCVSAVACNILRHLCGNKWSPREILLPCRRPRELQLMRKIYAAPVRFDADHLTIAFARSWLSLPIRGSPPPSHWTWLEQTVASESKIQALLPDVVRRVLRRLMLTGRASIGEVAAVLSVHRRTLDRQLDAYGVTFRDLVDEVRFAVAQQLLRDTQKSIRDIAGALHYSNQSAFATAFRRWSGMTASEWRAQATSR